MSNEVWEWKVSVEGNVQGVGFRTTAARLAREHEIRGYVRNLPNGTVEICAQGTQHHLESFLEAVRIKPGLGFVDQFKIDRYRPESLYSSFEVR